MNEALRQIVPSRYEIAHPDRIQVFTAGTPNGVKATIGLEEAGLPYETHLLNIGANDQKDPEYLANISPNGKIPTIVDPDGPDGAPIAIMESGALLLHIAEKSGTLMPTDPRGRSEVLQWLFFQVGHIGPMFGQFGHFFMAGREKVGSAYGEERYTAEAQRLLGILEQRLADREWIAGDFSVADVAIAPWIGALDYYGGKEALRYHEFVNVDAYLQRVLARPAVIAGRQAVVPS